MAMRNKYTRVDTPDCPEMSVLDENVLVNTNFECKLSQATATIVGNNNLLDYLSVLHVTAAWAWIKLDGKISIIWYLTIIKRLESMDHRCSKWAGPVSRTFQSMLVRPKARWPVRPRQWLPFSKAHTRRRHICDLLDCNLHRVCRTLLLCFC